MKNKNEDSGPTSSQSPKDYNCPALPPGFGKSTTAKSEESETRANQVIGPVLPPHLKSSSGSSQRSRSGVIGPALPPGFSAASRGEDFSDSSADEETIGPLPSEMNKDESTRYTAYQFEERSRKMKDRLEGKDKKDETIARESWMTELPSTKLGQSIGLSARTFRAHAGPDLTDQSAWTDSPQERERKLQEEMVGTGKGSKRDRDEYRPSKRDKKLRKEIDTYNKTKRPESLMEMHEKKLKEGKKTEEDKPQERRPFDRDLDLQANKFDEAQKKSIIRKSQNLNKRFGHGSTEFL